RPEHTLADPLRDAHRSSEEPARYRITLADRTRLADQEQERRLEGILGVIEVRQPPPAQGPDHRTVPRQQRLKRRFLTVRDESLQQVAVRVLDPARVQTMQTPQDGLQRTAGHTHPTR